MKLVNRISLIVTPSQTMHQWLIDSQFEGIPDFNELSAESSCYLVDEPQQELAIAEILSQLVEQHGETIWHSELGVWDEFGDNSPAFNGSEQFSQWFNVSLSGLTFDLAAASLVANVDSI